MFRNKLSQQSQLSSNYLVNTLLKLLVMIMMIIFIITLCPLITNKCMAKDQDNIAVTKPKPNKYHQLQVELNIIENSEANKDLLEKIKQDLLIVNAISEPKLTQQRIENLHYRATTEIIDNLKSLGYYHAKVINNSLINLSNNVWLAKYNISIGDPTIIKKIDLKVEGESNNNVILIKNIQAITKKLLIVGQKLIHENYEKTKQLILNQLHDYGFLDAKFTTSSVTINLDQNSALIALTIDSGQQYYFGEIIFESDLYNDDFLKKYLSFKPQDPYSIFALANLKNNLLNSKLFSKVRIDPQKQLNSNSHIIPIKVRVYAKSANHYNAGIGYGTDTGIRGKLGYSRRRRSHPGHEINLKLSASKIRKQILANYDLLGANPLIDKYSVGVSGQEVNVRERLHKNLEFFSQKTKKYNTREQMFKISFLTETFKELPKSNKKHAHFLMPSIHLSWVYPKFISEQHYNDQNETLVFGNKIHFITKIASKSALSSANLLQFNLKEKWLCPLIYDSRLIFKANVATTIIRKFDNLPHSLRFFAGGDNSVRGFAYNSLGPFAVDSAGNKRVIGGKHLLVTGLEIEKPIPPYDSLVLAGFIDAGNAFNNFHFDQLATGAGVGVGYRTPIGSIKTYLATPLRHMSFEEGRRKKVRFHLTFEADL